MGLCVYVRACVYVHVYVCFRLLLLLLLVVVVVVVVLLLFSKKESEKHLCLTDSKQRLRDCSGVVVMMMCHLICAPVACLCVSLAPSVP